MDYKRIHDSLIERAKDRIVEGYTEKHHIIPRCMGGSDDKDNLVELTAREHFLTHRLLCEIYPKERGLQYAVWMMSWHDRYRISSREYERLRTDYAGRVPVKNVDTGETMWVSVDDPRYKNNELVHVLKNTKWSDIRKQKHKERLKGIHTLNWFQERHGREEGRKLYNKYCEKHSGKDNGMYNTSIHDTWIKKYGKEKADKMWEEKYKDMKNTVFCRDLNNLDKGYFCVTKKEFSENDNLVTNRYGISIHDTWIKKYGKEKADKMWEERNLKISNTNVKKVIHIKSGNIFNSGIEASKKFGYCPTTISRHCNNKVKNQKFKFVE